MNSEKKGVKGETRLIVALILTAVFSLAATVECLAVTVSLQWNENAEDDLAGYRVYYKADSSTPPFNGTGAAEGKSPINVGNQTTATLNNLAPAHDWYFRVTAYDKSGNESGYSDYVSIRESVAPKVSLTAPVKNSTVHGTVAIIAKASDKSGVTKVDFYVNDDLKGTDNDPPYSYNWDSRSVDNGPYTLNAKAYDGADNVGQSTNVKVKVNNDKTAPVVNISSPEGGSTVKDTVIVKARATDNLKVTKVEFYVDGVPKKTDTVYPYSYIWHTTVSDNGPRVLTAKAYDKAENVGESVVTVTVENETELPDISISSPLAGSTVKGTVIIKARATDNVRVTKVEFYVNGVLRKTDTVTPFSYSWNTRSAANGANTLIAKAYDKAGNVKESSAVTVTVYNSN